MQSGLFIFIYIFLFFTYSPPLFQFPYCPYDFLIAIIIVSYFLGHPSRMAKNKILLNSSCLSVRPTVCHSRSFSHKILWKTKLFFVGEKILVFWLLVGNVLLPIYEYVLWPWSMLTSTELLICKSNSHLAIIYKQ